MRFETIRLSALLTTLILLPTAAGAETVEWTRQIGTSKSDQSRSVSADGLGNVYISGRTSGNLNGANAGLTDAFISKYDDRGVLQWTRQIGTDKRDESQGVSADGLGNVYISGFTGGNLAETNAGQWDAFVAKYDDGGTLEWTRQLGLSGNESGKGITADVLGNIYITGNVGGTFGGNNSGNGDAFIAKYDDRGTLKWTRQLGVNASRSVSADGLGNVYITGVTSNSVGGPNAGAGDAFISKYDDSGTRLWIRQIGSSGEDDSWAVSADGLGNVYISGNTLGNLGGANEGNWDAFVSKFDETGMFQWTRQLGTSDADHSFGISADGLGNVFISGQTSGSLGGLNAGSTDAFVSKYGASGVLQWTRQLGTNNRDVGWAISTDGLGNAYVSGRTEGDLGGTNSGDGDAFVTKLGPGVEIELIPQGSLWSYLDNGSNQETAWHDPSFDDSAWQAGPAQLGYGDQDEATVVNCGPSSPQCNSGNLATTYFRHTFEVEDADRVESLSAFLLRDDAAAVYLNGIEIFRDGNLSANAAFNTFATSTGEENGEISFTIEPVLLVDGENILAVEVHQRSAGSSDISFDFQLAAVMAPIPEPTALTLTALSLFGIVARGRRRRTR